MSKKAYVGVGGSARNVKNIYVGVGGVPRKVVKGYVGVNGVPELFWDGGGGGGSSDSWDFWESVSGILFTSGNSNVVKVNNKIAYYGAIWLGNWLSPILMSPDIDAVTFNVSGTIHTSSGTITDANNITWYYSASQGSITETPSVDCMVSDTHYSNASDAAQDLLDKIYAVPFHEEYQPTPLETVSEYYTDKRKALRKALGTYLFLNGGSSYTPRNYLTYSDNADTLITTALSYLENAVFLRIYINGSNGTIYLYGHNSSTISRQILSAKGSYMNFDYYAATGQFVGDRCVISVDSGGTIVYTHSVDTFNGNYWMGIQFDNIREVSSSNIGIEL